MLPSGQMFSRNAVDEMHVLVVMFVGMKLPSTCLLDEFAQVVERKYDTAYARPPPAHALFENIFVRRASAVTGRAA